MAINSVNTTNTSSTYGVNRKGLSGLASGMDTDEMIKGMTLRTRTKIAKQKQNKQMLSWQGDAMRNITDKLGKLSENFMTFRSSTNLISRRFFERTEIQAQGANASKVSVSGVGSDKIEVTRIKQLASDTSVSTSRVSSLAMTGKEIDLSADASVSNLEGKRLNIKYGGTESVITLSADKDYSTPEKIVQSLNELLAEQNIGTSGKLSDKVQFELVQENGEDKIKMSYKVAGDGNNIEITGGSQEALDILGFEKGDKLTSGDTEFTGKAMGEYNTSKTAADLIGGASMTFNLNGVLKTIKLPSTGELSDPGFTVEKLANHIQSSLDAVYGAGKIRVNLKDNGSGTMNKLEFTTTNPKKPLADGGFEIDTTSTLKLTDGDKSVLDVLGLSKGASNRLNLEASIKDAALLGMDLSNAEVDDDGNIKFQINGVDIEGITENTTLQELMDKINANEKAGVQVSYLEMADKFVITSKVSGESGKVEMPDELASGKTNLAAMIFGKESTRSLTMGQDAEVSIRYKGTGEEITLTRSTNSIQLEGMNINLKGTFGYSESGEATETEAITFAASANKTAVTDAVKKMVEEYNALVDLLNTELTTKRDRSYAPLTDEQRENMKEKEIENWEKKEKEGLLFGNPELRALASELRFVFAGGGSSLGLKSATTYRDNGKLEFNEKDFLAALDSDPDKVKEFFTGGGSFGDGAMNKLKNVVDKYAKASGSSRGILVQRAGSTLSPLSMRDNAISKQISDIDKVIAQLESRLSTEEKRYNKQFINLEKIVAKMNAQSGYLMQQFGQ